jgi:PPK2 family polyphosphate:nucleotide phosphotransferase
MDTERFRVPPGTTVDLATWATTADDPDAPGKKKAPKVLEEVNEHLADLQAKLYADGRHKVLIVLQGMDTSGKDGTIKHVFQGVNPLGVRVHSFKRPNTTELAHDYLWRVHQHTPGAGHLTIFNRSHYEDVLIVRVHDLFPEDVWRRRYGHLRDFERLLADEGTVVRKFFLHISKDEQKARLQERLDNPAKRWKFEHGDIEERRHWDAYQQAYADALGETSTPWAPWYVIPSDQKWYRNLLISRILIETLEGLDLRYPQPGDLSGVVVD